MGVYNPPSQVQFSPVSNFYQGKAIRQQIEAGEVDIEAKRKNIELADEKLDLEKRRVAAQEKQVELQEDRINQVRQEYTDLVGEKRAKKDAFDHYSIVGSAASQLQGSDGNPEAQAAVLEAAASRLSEYANSLPDGDNKIKTLKLLEGGLTIEELGAMAPVAQSNAAYYGFAGKPKNDYTLNGQRYDGETNRVIAGSPTERRGSINDHMGPVWDKIAKGEKLTKGQQDLLDIYTRETVEEKMLAALFGEIPEDGVESVPDNAPQQTEQRPPPTKDEALGLVVQELSKVPPGPERDAQMADILGQLKDIGVDITEEEVDVMLDIFSQLNSPGAVQGGSGPIIRE